MLRRIIGTLLVIFAISMYFYLFYFFGEKGNGGMLFLLCILGFGFIIYLMILGVISLLNEDAHAKICGYLAFIITFAYILYCIPNDGIPWSDKFVVGPLGGLIVVYPAIMGLVKLFKYIWDW